MYEKILVPLDGSSVDQFIIRHLLQLAPIHHSRVFLLRVLHFHTRDSLAHETAEAAEYLRTVCTSFDQAKIPAESIIEYGEPDEVILSVSVNRGCDLIAMASHGHRLIKDMLMGSVVNKVRHATAIPILVVRAESA